jgi:hypothetical protein
MRFKRVRLWCGLVAAWVAVMVGTALIAARGVGTASGRSAADAGSRGALIWDVSADQDVSRVGWPARLPEKKWFIDGPRVVILTVPSGHKAVYEIAKAQVRRNGRNVVNILLWFPAESLDAAHARALALADEWELPDRTPLEEWYGWRGEPPPGSGRTTSEHVWRHGSRAEVWVRPSYELGRERPWYVSLSYGFAEHDESAARGAGDSALN